MDRGRLARRSAAALIPAAAALAAVEIGRRLDRRAIAADPQAAELAHRLHGRSVAVQSADGTRLHAEVFGPEGAPTLVLAHGWTCSLQFWHYQLRDLSDEFRVVAYDQRGHGHSEAPRGGAYTTDALADDLDAVLDACVPAGERCVVAGHSMGGMTVVSWAGRHPERVAERLAAAALISTGMGDMGARQRVLRGPWGPAMHERVTQAVMGIPLRLPSTPTPLSHRAIRYVALSPGASAAVVDFCDRMVLACPAPVRAGFGHSLSRLDLYTEVPALTVPTVVIVGDLDRLSPPWHALRLAQSLPDTPAQPIVIEAVGHMAPLEAPGVVTAALRDLLRTHLATPSDPPAATSPRDTPEPVSTGRRRR